MMSPDPSSVPLATFKDRSGGLIAVGALLILVGLLCLIFAALPLISLKLSPATDSDSAHGAYAAVLVSCATYLMLATLFVWMGIGSILARRWARALMLVISVLWLATGVSSLLMIGFVLLSGRMDKLLNFPGGLPTSVRIAFGVMGGFMLVFYVILPLIFALFFRRHDVKATCEARDPKTRWTDRCPLPVLGLAVAMGAFSLYAIGMAAYPVMPFFGRLLTGTSAAVLQLAYAAILVLTAVLLYRLRLLGWWLAGILLLTMCVSTIVTFQMLKPDEWFNAMHLSQGNRPPEAFFAPFFSQMGAWTAVWACVAAGYLMYVKRFFVSDGGRIREPPPHAG